ncbi:hypothetical protein NQ318_017894 [Aromia moschata]|uniref:Fibronectin type-III domain-containing protein n=1 Tax=Aromia moschata TaxID=1265417 RepID=A0AAV8YBA7_9CUCU|nr:hypothetical protein NQ318_017894 [Aromia moschata]
MMKVLGFFALVGLMSWYSVGLVNGQLPCVPLSVVNLTMSLDALVTWDPNPDQNCSTSHYLIYVDSDAGRHFIYAVTRTTLNVSYLPVCDNYVFTVCISGCISSPDGESETIKNRYPGRDLNNAHRDVNLTVALLQVSQEENDDVYLEWSMDDDWLKCADRFRVIINDEEIDHIQDIYTFNTSIVIPSLAPCTTYEFGVVAIYNWVTEGPVTVVRHTIPEGVQSPPTLAGVELAAREVTLSWQLDSYARNKCPVSSAFVNIANNYNTTVSILDQTDRQPINITLSSLVPNSLYIVNTTVINSAGSSSAVLIAVQTTSN